MTETQNKAEITFEDFKKEVINDYKIAVLSRECSLAWKDVKCLLEKPNLVFLVMEKKYHNWLAKAFKNGDFRSGYYRDQTFMMAIGSMKLNNFLQDCMVIPI
jgi:hypothetical protein